MEYQTQIGEINMQPLEKYTNRSEFTCLSQSVLRVMIISIMV